MAEARRAAELHDTVHHSGHCQRHASESAGLVQPGDCYIFPQISEKHKQITAMHLQLSMALAIRTHVYLLAVGLHVVTCNWLSGHGPSVFGNHTVSSPFSSSSSYSTPKAATISGDIVIGGLFPVHKKSDGPQSCGEIHGERGIQRLEAMLYTIDEINEDPSILPGVELGASIYDTCSRDVYALEQALEYVRASMSSLDSTEFECEDGSQAKAKTIPIPVVGVIGGSYSSVSLQVANLLRLFKIPQISYASTSAALSDKTRFDYFARTVPPDTFQAKAMVDILIAFNWTYVSTVASEGDYGEAGIDAFQKEARAKNICIAVSEKIPQTSSPDTFTTIVENLGRKSSARVVVLFLRVEDAKGILHAARRQNRSNSFVWVASDGWGAQEMPVKGNQQVAEGALSIELQSTVIPGFDRYFKSLRPLNNSRNPWFKEYWEATHKCRLSGHSNSTTRLCSGKERITSRIYKQESKVQFVYDAVYAMAKALHSILQDECGERRMPLKECARHLRIDGAKLYKDYLLNISFTDRYNGIVQFNQQGDGLGRYNIMNYQRNRATGKYEYVVIGNWTNQLNVDPRKVIAWPGGTYTVPVSQCSKPCKLGEIKHMQEGDVCCWICTKCQPFEYMKDEFTCEDCGEGWWPRPEMNGCYALQEQYMQWMSVYALVPMCLSCVGIIVTLIVMVTFLRRSNTPIVKASGRELSFMLLSGCLVCYVMSFILLAKPETLTCAIQRFGVGLGFSVIYASLLTKTNRISRIFDSASKSAKRPAFISPRSQLVLSSVLISIQILCTCIWMVLEPPGTRHYYPTRDVIILKCKIQDTSFLISLIYNMLLIIICTVYAVKTRKIPENFNESKFIGFTMYTTCIIWLAFVPIYFGTLNSFQIQITTLCISISLSASVALMCLFAPKMYIIVFQPEKNVRKLTMNSATYKKANTMSTMSSNMGNHGDPCGVEQIKLHVHGNAHGMTTETETDRDSMASM